MRWQLQDQPVYFCKCTEANTMPWHVAPGLGHAFILLPSTHEDVSLCCSLIYIHMKLHSASRCNIAQFNIAHFNIAQDSECAGKLQGGDLWNALHSIAAAPPVLRWRNAGRQIALDIINGLHFLHSHNASFSLWCLQLWHYAPVKLEQRLNR